MTVYFNTYVNPLASRAQSLTDMSIMWNSPTPSLFDVLTFDILTRETVSRGRSSGQIKVHVFEKMLTDSPLLSSRHFSPVRFFTARSLFCSSTLTESLAQALNTWVQALKTLKTVTTPYSAAHTRLNKGASPTVSKRIVLLAVSVLAL